MNENGVLELFEATVGDLFISYSDLINKSNELAIELSKIILSVHDRYIQYDKTEYQKIISDSKLNNMVYIKLFNFIKNVDYKYKNNDKTFFIEFAYEQFDVFIEMLYEYVEHNIEINIVIKGNIIRISNFEKILKLIGIDLEDFYKELNFENSKETYNDYSI